MNNLNNFIAQTPITLPGEIEGFGTYGLEGTVDPASSPSIFNNFFSTIIGILTVIAGIWFFFLLVTGGIQWISSGGDKGKIEEARQKITMGIIGIAIVVAALFVADIVGRILGFPGILNPGSYIESLAP